MRPFKINPALKILPSPPGMKKCGSIAGLRKPELSYPSLEYHGQEMESSIPTRDIKPKNGHFKHKISSQALRLPKLCTGKQNKL